MGHTRRTTDTRAARPAEPRDDRWAGGSGARELRQNSRPQLARPRRADGAGRDGAHPTGAERPRSSRPATVPGEALRTRWRDHYGTGGGSRLAGARAAPGDQPWSRVPELQRLSAYPSTA